MKNHLPTGRKVKIVVTPALLEQFKTDLSAAHAEICKLQSLDPANHTWPVWSSPAHTIQIVDRLLAKAETAKARGETT